MLGEVATALGEKKVNLRAVHGSNEGGQGILRLVVDKFGVAKRVLARAGGSRRRRRSSRSDSPTGQHPRRGGEPARRRRRQHHVCVRERRGGREATVFLAVSDMKKALRALR